MLHLFLYENFLTANEWLGAKLTATSSCAFISLLGYCLGVGDRHTENILGDINSGACVHVDYSCLFDKAKTFDIPETVPFRFTPNMRKLVTLGNEQRAFIGFGTFAAKVVKASATDLCGLLDSLIYDPLIEWKGGTSKVDGNYICITIVEKTLSEFVRSRMLGCYGEVNHTNSEKVFFSELVCEASSELNLSKMYFGWAPFL
jgi:serine/threonine-protein kinase ATR